MSAVTLREVPANWELVPVKDEPDEELTSITTANAVTALLLNEDEIKDEDEQDGSVKESHSNSKKEQVTSQDASQLVLLTFKPFKEEEDNKDLSFLDDARLTLSPMDKEIDPDECSQEETEDFPTSDQLVSSQVTSTATWSQITSSLTKGLQIGTAQVLGTLILKDTTALEKASNGLENDHGYSESGQELSPAHAINSAGTSRVRHSRLNLSENSPDAGKTTEDGKRRMKMSEKLREFYEERRKARLAREKSKLNASDKAKSVSVSVSSILNISKEAKAKQNGSSKKRPPKSRRLKDSLNCPTCQKEFHYLFSFKRHMKVHQPKGDETSSDVTASMINSNEIETSGMFANPSGMNCTLNLLSTPDPSGPKQVIILQNEPSKSNQAGHAPPKNLSESSFVHTRALLASETINSAISTNSNILTPVAEKPKRVVLNVPKIQFNRNFKNQSDKGKQQSLPLNLSQAVNKEAHLTSSTVSVNDLMIISNNASTLQNCISPPKTINIVPIPRGNQGGNSNTEPERVVPPYSNPPVVIAPIEDMDDQEPVPIAPQLEQHPPAQEASSIPNCQSNAPEEIPVRNNIISTINSATSQIISIINQASQGEKSVLEKKKANEMPGSGEISKGSEVVARGNDKVADSIELIKNKKRSHKKKGFISPSFVTSPKQKKVKGHLVKIKKGSPGKSSEKNEGVVKKDSPRKSSERNEDQAKNTSPGKSSEQNEGEVESVAIEENETEEASTEKSPGKSFAMPVRKRKIRGKYSPRIKRNRYDNDSGIDTESDGSDQSKKSPEPKLKDTEEEAEGSALIETKSGDMITPEELHKSITKRIKQRKHMEALQCPVCEKNFSYPSEIRRHIMMHTNEREFKCNFCPKAFARKPHLHEHMRTHTGERPFKCKSCPAAFAQKSNLVIHTRTHTDDRPFSCDQCGKRFRRQDAQTQHMMTHHSSDKPFSCAVCNAAFPCLRYLKDHMKCHSKERPYKCDQCDSAFVCNKYLKLHIRALHTNYRPYKCDQCPAKFTQSGRLIEHQRIHTGERPYTCSSCGTTFVRSGHLRRHLLTHTGERPYACKFCPSKFSQRDHLKRHLKSMHGGKK